MSPTPQALLAHAGWVRGLAHCLVSDPHLAEDLAQDAWVSALQSPPLHEGNMRGWLAQVLRNLVRQNRRSTGRRDKHERAAARPDQVPPTADLVERVSSHRAVVGAVLELDEPYRTAVLLRFFEGMPPRKIAQKLETPVSTVHTRIQRGLTMLRARLDHVHGGDRRSWLFAILPLARKEGGTTAAVLGALLMKTKLQIVLGAILVAIGLVAAWPLVTGAGGEPVQTGGAAPAPAALTAGEQMAEIALDAERQELPVTAAAGERELAAAAGELAIPVRGRLLNSEAQPLPGMGLQFAASVSSRLMPGVEPVAITGSQGEFEFLAEGGSGQIVVAQPGWTTVMTAVVNSQRPPEHALVVAAPAIDVSGSVVDEFGGPVSGARVALALPPGFRTRFTENSDAASNQVWTTFAAEDGTFELPAAANITGSALVATNPGFDEDRRPLPQRDEAGIQIVLRRTARAENTVSGQVVDPGGAIVEGAWVAIGGESTKSDELGNFTLKLSDQGPADRILAIKSGYQPARLQQPVDAMGQPTDWPGTVVLRLGEAPLSIHGQVVDHDGQPIPGARVWANDPTLFGPADGGIVTLEGVSAGGATRANVQQLLAGVSSQDEALAVMNRTPRADWNWVRADSDGRFELGGLSQRDYQLRAILDETLLMVDTVPVPAGTVGLIIQMPADAYYETIAGQVISHSGTPVSGVTVRPMSDPFVMRYQEQRLGTMHAVGDSAVTDAQGRFQLQKMPRTDVYLRLDGEDILPEEYGRFVDGGIGTLSGGLMESLQIVVSVRVHVQVELDDPNSADQIRVLDIDKNPLIINVFAGNSRSETSTLQLVDGRSPVIVVPDHATTMVFLKDRQEVRTVNLGLIAGEINQIRW